MMSENCKKCPTHGPNCDGACIDPSVDNGITTKIWGSPMWFSLFCIALGYPYAIDDNNPKHKTKRNDYKIFFTYIGQVLPCKYCRDSYVEFIKTRPIDNSLENRKDLAKWLYDIKNMVNDKLGVPECDIPEFQEVYDYYEQFRAKCSKTTAQERENSLAKGCIVPATGKKKRCILKIVDCPKNDITRQENSETITDQELPSPEDYYLILKSDYWLYIAIYIISIIFIISIILVIYGLCNRKTLYKLLKL